MTWRWRIASYLFLAGTGSGAYAASTIAGFFGSAWDPAPEVGVALGAPLVFIGMLFLISDLGAKKNALRAFVNVRTSWMARGSWIISAFVVLAGAQLAALLLHWGWPSAVSALTVALAVATMIYTGFLLKACRGISFWSTAVLPVLFLASASSTGVMAVVLGGAVYSGSLGSLAGLAKADAVLVIIESLVLAAYLERGRTLRQSRGSVRMWLRGSLAPAFWVGVVVCGLLVPLAFDVYPASTVLVALAMSLGLAGGLVLRRIILAAGTRDALFSISPSDPGAFWGKVLRGAAG